ncbi:MAG: OmpH family outer membrane protein [Bacteroidetes bacterium]|nr:OmpH family outer membrane protein [Bacteroidota bacterium]
MNKNISLVLNVVLSIAVAILYYLHFTSNSGAKQTADVKDSTVVAKQIVLSPTEIKASKIVYVNLDILSKNYDFLKDVSTSAQAEQNVLQTEYQTKGQKLQQDYADFQEKENKGMMSDNQISGEQEKFAARKDELDQLQLKSDALGEKIQARTEEARKNLTDYIKEYNKSGNYNYVLAYSEGPLSPVLLVNDSLDITKDILDGINARYKESKGKKK